MIPGKRHDAYPCANYLCSTPDLNAPSARNVAAPATSCDNATPSFTRTLVHVSAPAFSIFACIPALAAVLAVAALLLPSSARAQQQKVTTSIALPGAGESSAVAINPGTNYVYVANEVGLNTNPGIIYVINASTNTLVTSITQGSSEIQPFAIALDTQRNKAFIVNTGGGSNNGNVTVVDGTTTPPSSIAVISNGNSIHPSTAVMDVTHNILYVANSGSSNITVFNFNAPNSYTSPGSSTISLNHAASALALNPSSNLLYATTSDGVVVITTVAIGPPSNIPANGIVSTIAAAAGASAVAVDTNLNTAYAAVANIVYAISGSTYSGSNNFTDHTVGSYRSLAVNPYSHRIYAAGGGGSFPDGCVSVFSGGSLVGTAATAHGDSTVQAVAVDTFSDIAFATQEGGYVSVISGATGTDIADLNVGSAADEVAVNPITHKAYSTAGGNIAVIDGATYAADPNSPTAVNNPASASGNPYAIAVNPVLNEIYVTDKAQGDVVAISGSDGGIDATISTGGASTSPQALVVDPVNNVTYVAVQGGGSAGSIAEIDANNNVHSVTLSPYGGGPTIVSPDSLAYNPINNFLYGGSSAVSLVFAFQGGTFGGSSQAYGGSFGAMTPIATAVNPAAGMNYTLFKTGSGTPYLAVNDDVAPYGYYVNVCTSSTPQVMDVNTVTDSVYIGCSNGDINIVTGANGYTTGSIQVISNPNFLSDSVYRSVAVNPITNKIYIADSTSASSNPLGGSISVIDGSSNTILNTIVLGSLPSSVAVNQASNKAYVLIDSAESNSSVTVIDGFTDSILAQLSLNANANQNPSPAVTQIAANPVTGTIYTVDVGVHSQVQFIDETTADYSCLPTSCLNVTIAGVGNFPSAHASDTTSQTFTFNATNSFDGAPVNGVYYQLDTQAGPWLAATGSGPFTGSVSGVNPGFHILYAYATDEEDSTSSNGFGGLQSSPLVGPVQSFGYLVEPPNALAGASNINLGNTSLGATSSPQNVTLANEGGATLNFGYTLSGPNASDFTLTDPNYGTSCASASSLGAQQWCALGITFTPSTATTETATITFMSNSLQATQNGPQNASQVIQLSGTGTNPPVPQFYTNPGNPSYLTSGVLGWNDADSNAAFQCSLVISPAGPSYSPCTSPYNYSGLQENTTYTFSVEAIDGGTSSPATWSWQVVPSQITLTFAGTGTGFVTSSPSGLSCTSNCTVQFNGVPVTLTATPTGSSTFAGWTDTSGADPNDQCPVAGNPTQCYLVTQDSFKSATATFTGANFPSTTNVCQSPFTSPAPCSQTSTFTYNIPSSDTYTAVNVLTQGASGQDFTLSSTTCTGSLVGGNNCTIDVKFSPKAPGLRLGAIQLTHSSSPTPATIFISAVGQGPAVGFTPSATSVILPSAGVTNPAQVAVDGAGNVYVASARSAGSVLKIPAGGGSPTTVGTGLNFPYGVAVDGAGNVYISNSSSLTNTVVEVTPANVQTTLPTTVFAPQGLALDAAGDLFIADSGNARVVELPANGSPQTTISTGSITLSNPVGVAFDAAGDLYIADSGTGNTPGPPQVVEVPANAGTPTVVNTGSYTLGNPYGVAVDAAGDLFIADFTSGGNGVIEIPASGSPFTVLGGHTGIIINTPITVAIDPSGNLYIPDYNEGTLTEFQRSQGPTLTYQPTDVGQTSSDSPQIVLMQNTGNQQLHELGFGLTVSGSDFSQVPSSGTPPGCTGSFSLSAGAMCQLPFSFTPTTGGPLTGSGNEYDNALNNQSTSSPTQTIPLMGTGLANQTLTVTGAGTGTGTITDSGALNCTWNGTTISPNPCSASYPYGTVVNLTAAGTGGSSFTTWGTDCDGSGPCSVTMTAAHSVSATFTAAAPPPTSTLTVNLLGTGNGSTNDSVSSPPPQSGSISCSESEGVVSGSCSDTYNTTQTAIISEVAGANTNFIGWTGCDSLTLSSQCVVSMTNSRTVTANFAPTPIAIPVTFPVSPVPVTETAVYNCPTNDNPCTAPEASEVQLTVQNVNTSFTVNVTATEVPPNTADGICESNIDNTAASVAADFDCRFLQFFNYGTDTASGGAIVPLCLPYSHGNCIHYEVSVGPNGTGGEPNAANYLGPVSWELTWNDDGVTPPASSYWTGSTPQVYDDPDYPVLPNAPYGTDCTTAMTNSGGAYNCQFEYNITIPGSYDPNRPVDSGIGGTTRQFNDVVIAWPPTNVPSKNMLPLLNAASAPDNSQVSGGSGGGIGYTVNLVNSGTNTVSGIVLSDPLPSGTGMNWTLASAPSGFGCMINGTNPSQILTCNPLTVAPGAANELTFHLTSPTPAAGQYTNVATFTIGTQQTFGVAVLTVSSATQTITFAQPTSPQPYNASFPVSASSTSGLAVTITASGVCTINGGTSVTTSGTVLMTSGSGTCTLTASQAGNGSFNPATNVVRTVTATKAAQTITFAQPTSPAAYNSSFSVSGSSTSSLAVTITATGVCTINGSPTATTSGTVLMTSGSGTCTLTASQAGNGNYAAATNVVRPVTAALATQTITLSNVPTSEPESTPFTVSATGGASGNPITFTASGQCTNSGATYTTSASTGTCNVIANQAGTANKYAAAPQVTQGVTVTAAVGGTLKFSPTSFNFGTVNTGNTALATVTVTNTGTKMVTFSSFKVASITGDDSTGFLGVELCPNTLNAGKSCIIIMSFTADSQTTKVHAANLVITDNGVGSPQTIPMTVTAVINPLATFSPTSLSFSNQKSGTTSTAKSVTLKNTGTTPLNLSSISISGNFAFSTGSNACTNTSSLSANATCNIYVVFKPTSKGSKTGSISVKDNARNSPQSVSLSGTGN